MLEVTHCCTVFDDDQIVQTDQVVELMDMMEELRNLNEEF